MTRSESGTLAFELEIEKLAQKLRKEAIRCGKQPQPNFQKGSYIEDIYSSEDLDDMAYQTKHQLAAVPDEQQLLCITYLVRETPLELKSRLIHLLPIFCDLKNEKLHTHLKEFHMVIS
ncbi:hypothetical protein PVK06_001685 [Gossypium arboreum]|uniref:Uncharacterized protein n=1 Tax=Gossypium arboreum TaxID=29729 RepID=A0ABR0R1X7_GOSAR|nr:hypothetical protein PVK06_001685 [Gossypium arboreum]